MSDLLPQKHHYGALSRRAAEDSNKTPNVDKDFDSVDSCDNGQPPVANSSPDPNEESTSAVSSIKSAKR
jgi:hypothetical protein